MPFSQHSIVLSGLTLLILWRFLSEFPTGLVLTTGILFAVWAIYTFFARERFPAVLHHKNTFIFLWILLLIINPVSGSRDIALLLIILWLTFLSRITIRNKSAPFINPVLTAGLLMTLLMLLTVTELYISWGGVNYIIPFLSYSLPFWTIVSVVLALSIIYISKKYLYAIGFFISFCLISLFLQGAEFVRYILTDGTIYFFFGVMALEPKTGVNGKYQLYFWILLGVLLSIFIKYHIKGDYISALLLVNLLFLATKSYLAPKNSQKKSSYPKWQKWVCVPCGFIYDPVIGDKDGNIAPGTEFTDIPDNWSCPDCGVTKADFIPYQEWHEPHSYEAKIVGHTMLNPNTLELIIEVAEKWISLPGQFMRFYWHDVEWTFSRMYSVVEQIGNQYTFAIKLTEWGRGQELLRNLTIGDTVDIGWLHGRFLLCDTSHPKIFIATGTGLAPIYHMIKHLPKDEKTSLYFSVATEKELFYTERLKAFKNVDLHIHVTREKIDGHNEGRVDIANIEASPETEWYLCGNPKMIAETKEILKKRWFQSIFAEEFN